MSPMPSCKPWSAGRGSSVHNSNASRPKAPSPRRLNNLYRGLSMNTLTRRLTPLIMTALGAVLAAEPILAAESDELQEIVVTARKRDESLQSVPVTVDVF